ncbi:hepatic lectin-like [Mytilus galloprovincialis]|uniref:hepatic lectin-like n=1 Tax=Mytilus galloprovincialis TaxID=29158 RepID=UPI003F7B7D35
MFVIQNECSRKGSHLVKVDNRAEDVWLQTNIENDGVWIDAIDKWHEGHWISYSDGTSLPYTAWKKGEPNDENYSENCAYMRIDGWNDCPCNERALYVCEKEM